ncbi:MAG TPA: glycosyltransferase, partial [Candidatus Omnitrophota bacterium]|nr:glycosyltransferase [Candidatus Omnitrophota bacterium]
CAGVPVAASRVGGLLSIIEDGKTGLFFDPGKEDQIVLSIERLLDDRELVKKINSRAKIALFEKFTSEKMADDTLKAYKACLK